MKYILHTVEAFLVLLGIATVLVLIFLWIPGWSPFQTTLGSTVIPVATMVAAWTTLLVAYAAFRTIKMSSDGRIRDRKEQLLNEIICWAKEIHNNLVSVKTEDKDISRYEERIAGKGYKDLPLRRVLLMDNIEMSGSEYHRIEELIREGNFIEIAASGTHNDEIVKLIQIAVKQIEHRRQLVPEYFKLMNRRMMHEYKNENETEQHLTEDTLRKIVDDAKRMEYIKKLIEDKSASLNDLDEDDQACVKLARNTRDIEKAAENIVNKAIETKLSLLK